VVGLGFLGYLLFPNLVVGLFNFSSSGSSDLSNQASESGVVVQEVVVGTGLEAQAGDLLTVHYVGTLSDGKVFDSSIDRNTPFSFTLGVGQVIRGWDDGVVGMKVGGKRTLIIAPDYGYGAQVAGPIPANSTLIFEVELLDVKKPSSR